MILSIRSIACKTHLLENGHIYVKSLYMFQALRSDYVLFSAGVVISSCLVHYDGSQSLLQLVVFSMPTVSTVPLASRSAVDAVRRLSLVMPL